MPDILSNKVFVAGHRGMVGSAIVRRLQNLGYENIVTKGRDELDLLDQQAVNAFFKTENIDEVYLAAAKVGGIIANNSYPADFIYQNLTIQTNIIHAAHLADVQKLLFLGSSCIYPKLSLQPIVEDALLQGPLEPTNEPYAIAKIAGIKMCESYNRQYSRDYRSVMPTNLYGPGDNFHPENSHVIPGLIRRFDECKKRQDPDVTVWGTGNAMREFLYVDDMAAASVHVHTLPTEQYQGCTQPQQAHINIGTGIDCTIRELAETIKDISGFAGELKFDTTKPDGTPRKLLDVDRSHQLGWQAQTTLKDGLAITWDWYQNNVPK